MSLRSKELCDCTQIDFRYSRARDKNVSRFFSIILFQFIVAELNIGIRPSDETDMTPNVDPEVLQETFVIEAFNLKAAIEYQLKNGLFYFEFFPGKTL